MVTGAPLEIRSAPDEGLLGVVTRAQKAVLTETEDAIGVLSIELSEPPSGDLRAVGIEVAYGERLGEGVIERLDLHFSFTTPGRPPNELLTRLLRDFGGTGFTNICLCDATGDRELADVTLHFSSSLRVLAECSALVGDDLKESELGSCKRVLGALGLSPRVHGSSFTLSRRQLRRGLALEDQVRAIELGLGAGLAVDLYAATLPVTRAARLAARPGDGEETRISCTLSRRPKPESSSAATDAVALRDVLSERFDFDFGDKSWRIDNAHAERAEYRPHGPMGNRKPLAWSINFGAKRS